MRLTLALLLCACIERPYDEAAPAAARPQVDRDALRDVLQPPPPDATPVGALFGNAAELLAYKLEPPALVPGQRMRLTLYWRCRAEMEQWHIFVHLDDATGTGERIHAEHDPAGGRFPTDAWKPGDSIADAFYFNTGRDPLLLFLGFFSQGDNRLPLNNPGRGRDDGNNRLLAGVLPVAH
ncbi:MAG TPA: hypothetical protein VLW85_18070 [Myxococcales bacterium]|nr:hypothetical protein [Myxococcales bacterium]